MADSALARKRSSDSPAATAFDFAGWDAAPASPIVPVDSRIPGVAPDLTGLLHWGDDGEPARAETKGPDTKYTHRAQKDFDLHVGSVPAKIQLRWEMSIKDRGSAHTKVRQGDVAWGSNQVLLQQSEAGLNMKVSTALMSAKVDLLADGVLPDGLSALPITPRVEIKGLDAGLSLKNPELKLATFALVLNGDFSPLLDERTRPHVEAQGQVRMECALAPDLAKHLVELAKATDDIERYADAETAIAKKEKKLLYARKIGRRDEIKSLEKELNKLRGIRGKLADAKNAGINKIKQVGVALDKSPAGRLLKKVGGKALGMVFKKFIPIYNVVSTAQDIYEAGEYLAGLNWQGIGDKIMNGGEGGTVMGDGSQNEEGIEGTGTGEGEGGDIDADSLQRELDAEENVQLHSTALAVLAALEIKGGAGAPLSKEAKEHINYWVPADLTPEEIEALKIRISSAGADQQDLVVTVIEAMQEVRPLGQKRLGPSKYPEPPMGPAKEAPKASRPRTEQHHEEKAPKAKAQKAKRAGANAGTWIVDPEPTLRRVIKVDAQLGRVTGPSTVDFPGFTATVKIGQHARLSGYTGEDTTETSVLVTVTITPLDDTSGLFWNTGHAIKVGVPVSHVVTIPAR